jgi:hypothetical protein
MVSQPTGTAEYPPRPATLPQTCRDIESIADVIVWTHTAVGRSLQAVATRENDAAQLHYARDDVEQNAFVRSIEQLPPVPAEPGFVTYGFDERQVLWLAIAGAGVAIGLDRETSTNLTTLAQELYDCGLGAIEPPPLD